MIDDWIIIVRWVVYVRSWWFDTKDAIGNLSKKKKKDAIGNGFWFNCTQFVAFIWNFNDWINIFFSFI